MPLEGGNGSMLRHFSLDEQNSYIFVVDRIYEIVSC